MGLGAVNVDVGKIFSFLGKAGEVAKGFREAITGKKIQDPAEMKRLENQAVELENNIKQAILGLTTAQTEINKIEAQSGSRFIAGWRPACGWLCVLGLAWQVFIWPIWVWIATLMNIPKPPDIETALLVTLLMGMLGLGTLRTFEKGKDIQNRH